MADAEVITVAVARPNLLNHYLNEDTADIFFLCSDEADEGEDKVMKVRVPAHKVILASASSVFQAMFYGLLPEQNQVELTDTTADALKEFLQLFYKNDVTYTIENIQEVMYLADKYNVPDCTTACCTFLKQNSTPEKMMIGYVSALHYNLLELKFFFENEMLLKREQFFRSTYFLHCSKATLKSILKSVYLKGEGEMLFLACMAWAEEACDWSGVDSTDMKNRRQMLDECFDLIEFASIKRDVVMEFLKNFHCLFKTNELDYIFQLVSDRVTTYNDSNNVWPYTHCNREILELERGTTLSMQFQTNKRCLLYGIALYIDGAMHSVKAFTLVVTIQKTKMDNGSIKKTKVYVGTGIFRDNDYFTGLIELPLPDEDEFRVRNGDIFSTPLPDIIIIEENTKYDLEIVPFENMKLSCFEKYLEYYEDKDRVTFTFDDLNFALLHISAL